MLCGLLFAYYQLVIYFHLSKFINQSTTVSGKKAFRVSKKALAVIQALLKLLACVSAGTNCKWVWL
jgi:hypothetical protein